MAHPEAALPLLAQCPRHYRVSPLRLSTPVAALESPHWESTPPETRRLLETIGGFSFCRRFYLGGGTALALRLGHRLSRDLDFFSETEDVGEVMRAEILDNLRRSFPEIEIITDTLGDLTVSVMGRDVGFYILRLPDGGA